MLGLENYYEFATGTRLADTTLNEKGKAYTNDLGIFASGKIQILPQLTLQTGARATYNLRYGSAITPSTWLHWSPNLPIQWRFSWAYGFRSPAIKELFFSFIDINHFVTGNPNLKPERSVNFRSEITWDIIKTKPSTLTLTQTGFINNVQDRIILTALGPVHYEYQNVDIWKTLGGGMKLTYQYEDWLKIQSEAITTGFNNTNDNVEVEKGALLWSTDWSNDITISFLKDRLHWNIWHKRTGKTPFFYNQDGKTQQGSTDTWNMLNSGLSAQLFKNKVRLNAGVKNIFDIRQLQVNNNNGIHIEASNQQNLHWGRSVYLGVTVQM
jgi:outer membrane receptor for ferrienterochelin and colicins